MTSGDPKATAPAVSGSASITLEQRTFHRGPLPDPADLARYDQLVAGGAERIMRIAEADSEHLRALERAVVGSDIGARDVGLRLDARGQTFALAMGLATLATCLAAALTGHDGAAIALAASSLVGVVAAFLGARLRDAGSKHDATG